MSTLSPHCRGSSREEEMSSTRLSNKNYKMFVDDFVKVTKTSREQELYKIEQMRKHQKEQQEQKEQT